MKLRFVLLEISAVLVFSATAQRQLTVDQVMSSDEMKSTGVSTLSQAQRTELDRWLTRYTYLLLAEKKKSGGCDPAIEARIPFPHRPTPNVCRGSTFREKFGYPPPRN
jgi:hypothetical protein